MKGPEFEEERAKAVAEVLAAMEGSNSIEWIKATKEEIQSALRVYSTALKYLSRREEEVMKALEKQE